MQLTIAGYLPHAMDGLLLAYLLVLKLLVDLLVPLVLKTSDVEVAPSLLDELFLAQTLGGTSATGFRMCPIS